MNKKITPQNSYKEDLDRLCKVSYQTGVYKASNYLSSQALKIEMPEVRNLLFSLADEIRKLAEQE